MTNDADEEDGQGGKEDYLEYQVNSDEDSVVFVAAAGEIIPNEDLKARC